MSSTLSMRFKNVSGDEACHWCDDGLVCVGTRRHVGADYDQYAPCPFCERGLELEFSEKGPWRGGFWHGNEELKAELLRVGPPLRRPPASKEESRAWIGEIVGRVELAGVERPRPRGGGAAEPTGSSPAAARTAADTSTEGAALAPFTPTSSASTADTTTSGGGGDEAQALEDDTNA